MLKKKRGKNASTYNKQQVLGPDYLIDTQKEKEKE